MKYAVIDIGSNTVRMVICTVKDGRAEISGNERASSIILRCIKNGRLTLEGISFLVDTINNMKTQCGAVDGIFAFATAAMRDVENAADVCRIVEESTGVRIRVISGGKEAEYDFYSLCYIGKTMNAGMGVDLGGGSCQMFTFENDALLYKTSLPIGSARMQSRFVSGAVPTADEARAVYDYIYGEAAAHPELSGFESVWAIGGSARCSVILYNRLFDASLVNMLEAAELKRLAEYMVKNPERTRAVMEEVLPDRLNSLATGIVTLCAICSFTGAKRLVIAMCGVREGFIYKEILQGC